MELEFDKWLETVPETPQSPDTSICTAGEKWNTIIVTRGGGLVGASQTIWGFRVSPNQAC